MVRPVFGDQPSRAIPELTRSDDGASPNRSRPATQDGRRLRRYASYKTVHRRFQTWCQSEVLRRVLTDIANELRARGVLDEEESFIDATFAMAKGGGADVGPTKRGKGLKIMAIVDRHGLPLSVSTHAANHHEVRLVQLCAGRRSAWLAISAWLPGLGRLPSSRFSFTATCCATVPATSLRQRWPGCSGDPGLSRAPLDRMYAGLAALGPV